MAAHGARALPPTRVLSHITARRENQAFATPPPSSIVDNVLIDVGCRSPSHLGNLVQLS